MATSSHRSLKPIEPFDPYGSLTTLRATMNRLFEESVLGLARFEPFAHTLPVDIREIETEYILDVALPGVKPEDVQITASDNALEIYVSPDLAIRDASDTSDRQKEKHEGADTKGDRSTVYVRRERYVGEMSRMITLPTLIIPDKVTASYEHGILTIHAPKAARVAPKRIAVQVNGTEPQS